MNKDITYTGFTTCPSDHEVPDGQLSLALNLIPEDNHIAPLQQPNPVFQIPQGYTILMTHKVPNHTNYILISDHPDQSGNFQLSYFQDLSLPIIPFGQLQSYPKNCTPVGNTLAFATDKLQYFLWKDSSYHTIGCRPPFISIDFGLKFNGTAGSQQTSDIHTSVLRGGERYPNTTEAYLAEATNHVFACFLPQINEQIMKKGYFYLPFFIRYAYRLYDGSYQWHSSPILMMTSAIIPEVFASFSDSNDEYTQVTSRAAIPFYQLYHRILLQDTDQLSLWKDIVAGIDIFISQPIYTYRQDLSVSRFLTSYSSLLSTSAYFYPRQQIDSSGQSPLDYYRPGYGEGGAEDSGGDLGYQRPGYEEHSDSDVFIRHVKPLAGSYYTDEIRSADGNTSRYWQIQPNDNFFSDIESAHQFYEFAKIDFDNIAPMDSMVPLVPDDNNDLTNLVTRPKLPDDSQSHFDYTPSSLYAFNNRLNVAVSHQLPPEPFPIHALTSYYNDTTHTSTCSQPVITVWTRINGVKVCRHHSSSFELQESIANTDRTPLWIYYPDPNAYKMKIQMGQGRALILDLKRHDFLNGAYFFHPYSPASPPVESQDEPDATTAPVECNAKILTSEINNPFLFPSQSNNTIGFGQVLGITSAAKALSQGQFGQFPLYAFTSEGVWALEVGSDSSYTARQPISRDVCISADGIAQLDSSVLFPTDRGIMLISGSQTMCISDTINSEFPFDVLDLPGFKKLHVMLEHNADNCLPTLSFSKFLKKCKIIYDYVHQHVIVYAPSITYAYVYSLKSQQWGMIFSNIAYHFNSYPEALAVDTDNNIINFSYPIIEPVNCLYVSRPLKLDAPDIHKTINTIIQRGNFIKGHVSTVLYGSRDLVNWHLVWSSKDHYLRGFSGTPYKYFRIAGVANLHPQENIVGASIQFTPKLTNQPR